MNSNNKKILLSVLTLIVVGFLSGQTSAAVGRAKNFTVSGSISDINIASVSIVVVSAKGDNITLDAGNSQITKSGKKNSDFSALATGDYAVATGKILPDGTYLAQHIKIFKPQIKKAKVVTKKVVTKKTAPQRQ